MQTLSPSPPPQSIGVPQTQKLNTHLLRTQSSEVLLLKPGAGLYIAMHVTPTVRNYFLANLSLSAHSTAFFQTSPEFFPCWLWLTSVSVWACRIKWATLLVVTDNLWKSRAECPCIFSGSAFRICGHNFDFP